MSSRVVTTCNAAVQLIMRRPTSQFRFFTSFGTYRTDIRTDKHGRTGKFVMRPFWMAAQYGMLQSSLLARRPTDQISFAVTKVRFTKFLLIFAVLFISARLEVFAILQSAVDWSVQCPQLQFTFSLRSRFVYASIMLAS